MPDVLSQRESAGEVADVVPIDGAQAVKELINDSIQKRRQVIRMPWSVTCRLTAALQPGTVTIFCGSPGASKSFAALELLAYVQDNHPAAYFALEDSRGFHLVRLLAQKTETPGLTNPNWIEQNPIIAKSAHAENTEWLSRMGRAVDAADGGQVTYSRLISWVLQRASAGNKLLVMDPITVVQYQTPRTWNEDDEFLQRVKRIAVDFGVAVLLISNPSKIIGAPGLESLAGGAAFSRFAQTILWFEAHEVKTSDVRFICGCSPANYNRTIHIVKARLGQGQGLRIAATFTDSLRLIEHGVVVKRKQKRGNV